MGASGSGRAQGIRPGLFLILVNASVVSFERSENSDEAVTYNLWLLLQDAAPHPPCLGPLTGVAVSQAYLLGLDLAANIYGQAALGNIQGY